MQIASKVKKLWNENDDYDLEYIGQCSRIAAEVESVEVSRSANISLRNEHFSCTEQQKTKGISGRDESSRRILFNVVHILCGLKASIFRWT